MAQERKVTINRYLTIKIKVSMKYNFLKGYLFKINKILTFAIGGKNFFQKLFSTKQLKKTSVLK